MFYEWVSEDNISEVLGTDERNSKILLRSGETYYDTKK